MEDGFYGKRSWSVHVLLFYGFWLKFFPLWSPEKKFTDNFFFYDERLIFVNFYALRLNFSAVSRLMVDPIEIFPVTEAGLYRQSNRHIGYLIKYSFFRQRLSRHFNFVFSLVFVYIIFIVAWFAKPKAQEKE